MATIRELATGDPSPVDPHRGRRGPGADRATIRDRFSAACSRASRIPGVKRAIALALGKLADTEALDLLTAALRDARMLPSRSATRPSRRSR